MRILANYTSLNSKLISSREIKSNIQKDANANVSFQGFKTGIGTGMLGALVGFAVGGPLGAAIGAGIGGAAGGSAEEPSSDKVDSKDMGDAANYSMNDFPSADID